MGTPRPAYLPSLRGTRSNDNTVANLVFGGMGWLYLFLLLRFGGGVEGIVVKVIVEGPIGIVVMGLGLGLGLWWWSGEGVVLFFVGIEEEAGVEGTGATEGEFVEGEWIGCGEEFGGYGEGALVLPAEVADEGTESGGDAGEATPVTRIVFHLPQYLQDYVVRQF